MPRDLGGLAARLGADATYLVVCWRVLRQDGVEHRFSTHTRDLVVDGEVYTGAAGLDPAAYETSLGVEIGGSEISGFVGPGGLEEADIARGRFTGAMAWQFAVDYEYPDIGRWRLASGTVGEIKIKGQVFTAELRELRQYMNLQMVDMVQATCRYAFGDEKCGATVRTNSGTVTSAASERVFTVAGLANVRASDFFTRGWVKVTSAGDRLNLKYDVADYDGSTGTFTLATIPFDGPKVGDTIMAYEGCQKTVAACQTKLQPDGVTVNNILRYGGEPDSPGNDYLFRIVRA